MQTEEQAPGTYHSQDFCNQVPRSKEQEEVDFEENTTDALMDNNITDQSNHKFEGFQNKDVEEILGEAEKNQTILGPQVYLCCKTTVTVSKHLLFKYNCVASKKQ